MKNQFLIKSNKSFIEGNIYANKSSLILDWILQIGIDKKKFTMIEVARDRDVSVGLVQRAPKILKIVQCKFKQWINFRNIRTNFWCARATCYTKVPKSIKI